MLYLVLIHVRPGQLETLRDYERAAAPVMARHGGRFVRVLRPIATPGSPDEVHLLEFDSADGFASFRADPALEPHLPLRDRAVERATVIPCEDLLLTGYFASEP